MIQFQVLLHRGWFALGSAGHAVGDPHDTYEDAKAEVWNRLREDTDEASKGRTWYTIEKRYS